MIVFFTDFSGADPYVGQMHAVCAAIAPQCPRVDLLHTVPDFDIRAAAYLLPALAAEFPDDAIFVCVVDPGVGGSRRPVMLQADGRWYVGPDNGLLTLVSRFANRVSCSEIQWRPETLSDSFHGRDLFAPVAAMLATGQVPDTRPAELTPPEGDPWSDDWPAIIYIDHFGNAMTGIRGASVDKATVCHVGDYAFSYARTFSEVAAGQGFWHINANGLVELSANRANLALTIGQGMRLSPG